MFGQAGVLEASQGRTSTGTCVQMLVCGDRVAQATIIDLSDDAIAVKLKMASQSKFNAFAS